MCSRVADQVLAVVWGTVAAVLLSGGWRRKQAPSAQVLAGGQVQVKSTIVFCKG